VIYRNLLSISFYGLGCMLRDVRVLLGIQGVDGLGVRT